MLAFPQPLCEGSLPNHHRWCLQSFKWTRKVDVHSLETCLGYVRVHEYSPLRDLTVARRNAVRVEPLTQREMDD